MGLLPLLCFQLLRLLPLRWLPSASRYQDKGFAAPSSSSSPSGLASASAFIFCLQKKVRKGTNKHAATGTRVCDCI